MRLLHACATRGKPASCMCGSEIGCSATRAEREPTLVARSDTPSRSSLPPYHCAAAKCQGLQLFQLVHSCHIRLSDCIGQSKGLQLLPGLQAFDYGLGDMAAAPAASSSNNCRSSKLASAPPPQELGPILKQREQKDDMSLPLAVSPSINVCCPCW